jgi:hypothetical protein
VNCLDAETLAAWMDGGLTTAALEDVRAHVADCERCQALVGAIGRTRAAIPASEPQRAPRRWLMWSVPLAAAATAIAVWVAIPQQRNAAVVPPTIPLEKQERAQPEPPAPPTPQSRSANTAAPPSRSGQRSDDIAQLAPDAVITESAPPPPAAPAAEAPKAVAGQVAPRAEALARDAAGLCGPPPPPGTSGQLITSSTAGPDVCWAVGRAGLVLRSTDGRSWQRIDFPEMTDLTSVRATDARTASVSTADGRTFSTANGGQTWAVR